MAISTDDRAASYSEWREHWLIPVVSLIALMVTFSHIYTIGLFFAPLEKAFGWSRAIVASGLTIVSIISVMLAPAIGILIDRYGSRRIALPGLFIYCSAFASLSLVGPSSSTWFMLWIAVGFGSVCVKPTVWAAAITSRFDRARGLAMSIALCGSGMGGMFLPYIATVLIDTIGWRGAFAAIGAIDAILTIPPVFLFFMRGQEQRRRDRDQGDRSHIPGIPAAEAFRSGRFIRLAIATLGITIALLAVTVHYTPILLDRGIDRRVAALAAGLIGLSMLVGRLGTGLLLDRFNGARVGLVAFGLPVVACAILLADHGIVGAIAAALVLGLSLGSEVDVVMYLASRYFGLRHFGLLYGTLSGLTSLGTGVGPLLSAYLHDRYGSYDPLIAGVIPVFLITAVLVGSLGAYPMLTARRTDPPEPAGDPVVAG